MKEILVMGMQSSGISAATLLEREGFRVWRYDDKVNFEGNRKEKGENVLDGIDGLVISPSIPNVHPVLKKAKELGLPIRSEMDLGVEYITGTPIAVTGTNGKTTTVDMLDKAMRIMGKKARTMGNVGYPVTQVVLDGNQPDFDIIEASSFQLEYTHVLKPKIAMLLNLSPDHMDRYENYEAYVAAKERIFINQTAEDYAVLNRDSRILRELGKSLKAETVYISAKEPEGLFFVKDNYFYYDGKPLISVKESRAKGEHNRFNLMAAMCVMHFLGADKDQMAALVREYKVLPHRVEYVGTVGNKGYYNDSKGTNIGACRTAVNTVSGRIGLILGGSDKGEDFCELFDALPDKVSVAVATGANAMKIFDSAQKVGFSSILVADDLESALLTLKKRIDVDNVLFSPASASFDRFSGYQERGDFFKELVYALQD